MREGRKEGDEGIGGAGFAVVSACRLTPYFFAQAIGDWRRAMFFGIYAL